MEAIIFFINIFCICFLFKEVEELKHKNKEIISILKDVIKEHK